MVHLYLKALCIAISLASIQARYVAYYDQWHSLSVPNRTVTKGIDHVITAFANSSLFTTQPAGNYTPFEDIRTVRSRFDDGTKVLIAIGGWGDTAGFGVAAATEASRKVFASNIASLLTTFNFDGCDIDWEYPGGNGADYRQIPNSDKVSEIDNYPLLLAEIRKAIGPHKLLTIAVPGLRRDMIAYTPEKSPAIWESLDWVNVMTYDLMNRRDNITLHHTSVKASLDTINYYIDELHLKPEMINLGFPMYSKWARVRTNTKCETGLGCETELLEAADGSDTGNSGTVTFQAANYAGIPSNMTESTDGSCGPVSASFCAMGSCCSASGFCGDTADFCNACQGPEYGSGCNTTGINQLFQTAMSAGIADHDAGGQYYYDRENHLFWTWDTAELIARKFTEIVSARKLGGVMFWSLGQDSFDFSHILALQKGARDIDARSKSSDFSRVKTETNIGASPTAGLKFFHLCGPLLSLLVVMGLNW